jgi:hypothetical protein
MATKQTTSVKTTTNLQSGQTKSFRTTYRTSSPTNIGKGGLSAVGRFGMITITILSISVGSALTEFTTADLIYTTPNYQINNEFIPIEDPLNTINYISYGSGVFERVVDFAKGFSDSGLLAKSYWDYVVAIFEPDAVQGAVVFLLDFNRLLKNIEDATAIYDDFSGGEKGTYNTIYDELNWLVKWMYYSPAELTA